MNFLDRIDNEELLLVESQHISDTHKLVMETYKSDEVVDISGIPLFEEALIIFESESRLTNAERKQLNDISDVGVKFFLDKHDIQSFAIKNGNDVIYITEHKSGNREIKMSLAEWNVFEKMLLDTGIRLVKGRSEIAKFARFMDSASRSVMAPTKIFISFAMRLMAMTVGVAYSSSIVRGIADAVKRKTGEPLTAVALDIISGNRLAGDVQKIGGWTVNKLDFLGESINDDELEILNESIVLLGESKVLQATRTSKAKFITDGDGDGEKSFVVIRDNEVIHISADKTESKMNLSEWESREKEILENGGSLVTRHGELKKWGRFVLSTLKWVSITALLAATVAVIVIATTGIIPTNIVGQVLYRIGLAGSPKLIDTFKADVSSGAWSLKGDLTQV